MVKSHLVTYEMMEKYYKEEMEMDSNVMDFCDFESKEICVNKSIGDDLDLFFLNLQNRILENDSLAFFLPKMLPSEQKTIEERTIDWGDYLKSFDKVFGSPRRERAWIYNNENSEHRIRAIEEADVSKVEMNLSEIIFV